jgi:hypothetical protein
MFLDGLLISTPVFALIFVPIWLLLDWAVKKYNFSNKFFNAFILFNAAFSSPINVSIVVFGLYHSLWKYELFAGVTARAPIIDTIPKALSFALAIIIVAKVKYLIWAKFNNKERTLESVLEHSARYFFQLPFLVPVYFIFETEDDISRMFLILFYLYSILAVAIYMYLSGKYRYKPFWFKNKKIYEKED